jgi:hypothetical protein
MNLTELRNYEKWENKSPVVIRKAVIAAGGWAKVFPMQMKVVPVKVNVAIPPGVLPNLPFGGKIDENVPGLLKPEPWGFPDWASRVRNYFNVTPVTLKLLPPLDGHVRTHEHRGAFALLPGYAQDLVFALNGDVYVDEHGTPWFNMIKPGTVYHFPGKVDATKIAAGMMKEILKVPMPIFKLISPDGTGGSMEVCLHNVKWANTICGVGEVVNDLRSGRGGQCVGRVT